MFAGHASCQHSLHPKMLLPAVRGLQRASPFLLISLFMPWISDTFICNRFHDNKFRRPSTPSAFFPFSSRLSSAVVWERVELGACSFWQGREVEVNRVYGYTGRC